MPAIDAPFLADGGIVTGPTPAMTTSRRRGLLSRSTVQRLRWRQFECNRQLPVGTDGDDAVEFQCISAAEAPCRCKAAHDGSDMAATTTRAESRYYDNGRRSQRPT